MSTSLLSLPVTSLQILDSVVLVPTTVFAQKIHKLYFPYHHLYTNIQNVNIIAIIASDFTSNFGFCGLSTYHIFAQKIHKLYFPYHHLYTNIRNINIIAIIASDFTSNFGFCGLGAYHSFCTKNSQTLLSISSFIHKYPKCQHHCYHCQ